MKTLLLLCTALLLSGCANMKGVEANDEERAACAAQGCTVWTERELRELVRQAMRKGYEAGKANRKGAVNGST
jgi:uncharacterized protein YceK